MPSQSRPRISVVNDNPDFLEMMALILEEDAGYDVTLFAGEVASIDDIAAAKPDLMIVDLLLGGASGWEIVALARADDRLSAVPIIVCTADVVTLRDRAEELERIGGMHILAKPFGIDDATTLVESLIGRGVVATG